MTSTVALRTQDGISGVDVNAVLIFGPQTTDAAAVFGFNRAASAALLMQMASAGGGVYVDYSTTPMLPF